MALELGSVPLLQDNEVRLLQIERFSPTVGLSQDDPDDFVGYEILVDFIEQHSLPQLGGDIVEIGVYMGRGTAKLARLAQRYGKKVYAIDIFDPDFDQTMSRSGVRASDVYRAFLSGRSMLEAYQDSIAGLDNVITIIKDSRQVSFPQEQRFFFGFIDGCHQRQYVENDFYLVWPHLVSGGALGFHDYKFDDWPEVTQAVETLVQRHGSEISRLYEIEGKYHILSLVVTKK
jgi:hypothetical protein